MLRLAAEALQSRAVTNADRISELYRGEILNAETQRRARDRVDWLVAQARGEVLDVGCSQGIGSFLCARHGLRVLGIDRETDRIEQAIAERARKPAEVAARVEFRVGDASHLEADDDSFDTILLGEVLEHLDDPQPVLAEAARVCKPDGIVALTTPFGVFPHEDHSQTFFLASLIAALYPQLDIRSIDIVDGYFRVTAAPGPMTREAADRLLLELQPFYEERLADLHNELHLVRVRRKRMVAVARELDTHLLKSRRALRRVRWERRLAERRRWTRIRAVLKRLVRHPGRIRLLPRDLWRALRPGPPPPKPDRVRRMLPKLQQQWERSSKHAELAIGTPRALKVDIPEAEVPAGPVARPDLRVATILDRFSELAFRYEWNQIQFGPEDWREIVEREQPNLLFVESAWRGNGDRWRDAVVGGSERRKRPLAELVTWCRERGIPTVFWSKEDPPNFGRFIDTAMLFDHVFTVDGDCIPRYAEILGNEQTRVLPFAVQPRVHNPISVLGGRSRDLVFAGSYYRGKHPVRREQMEVVLEPALEFGLEIFSRILQGEDERFDWPAIYQPHVVGSLPYERMLAAYKAYKLFLNVNSVTESPTMCARRVFELSACSTPVLSGYSRAIEEVFGDLVPVTRAQEQTRAKLADLLGDDEAREQLAHRAMRETFSKHTYGHRVDEVLQVAGLATDRRDPSVSVLSALRDADEVDAVAAQVARQTWLPLQLVLALAPGLDADAVTQRARAAGIHDVVAAPADGSPGAGGLLNRGLDAASGDLIAVVHPGSTYEDHFVGDLVHAFSYTDAAVVGKRAHYSSEGPGEAGLRFADVEHTYTEALEPGTLMLRGDQLRRMRFEDSSEEPETELLRRCASEGTRLYAADRFSFVAGRRDRSRAGV
jgi:2-polyprenyl-3-methyl-5-hydroxy-6-metoxy-1,4-benzoquinol methylase/spore maturation protein CgeB